MNMSTVTEIDIIDSKTERAALATRTDVLDKVGALATVPSRMFATTKQVAEFYVVDPEIVLNLVGDHRDEFEATGYRVITGPELRQLKTDHENHGLFKQVKALATWDRRAVLLLGMLLRDSEVAKAVRRYLLDAEAKVHEVVTAPAGATLSFDHSALEALVSTATTAAVNAALDRVLPLIQGMTQEGTKLVSVPKLPNVRDVAALLGVPEYKPAIGGLEIGFGRDGKPFAAYGVGRRREWLDRKQVIAVFSMLGF